MTQTNQSLCVSNHGLDREVPGRCFCQSLIQSWGKALALRESHSPLHPARWMMLALSLLAAAMEGKTQQHTSHDVPELVM